ncbi:helix-turn-helix transcriptional regulator [Streptomyces malaysiensis]|uniref:helix-turn-helix transcriptional regulator n=1 Tax=Streptomyces malaysiensis TaxID=92644 RepID=UPI0032201655|nr:LuxR family transcriptional regulator [Streptomyces malaysiensis]
MQLHGLPFPGREREQAMLAQTVADLGRGRSSVVTLIGRPGYGQSRLLNLAARLAEDQGFRVLRAKATPGERDVRYGVVGQLLAPMEGLTEGTLKALTGHGPESRLPGLTELLRTGRDRPTLLVVDDVEWLDPASHRWFGALIRRLSDARMVLLVSGTGRLRPGACSLSTAPQQVITLELELAPLAMRDVAATVALICGRPADNAFTSAALEASAGNPQVLSEALRRFTKRGYAPVAGRVPELCAITDAVGGEHVLRVLGGLSDTAVAVVRALAVCGDLLDLSLLYALAGPRAASEPGLPETLQESGLATACGTGLRLSRPEARSWILAEMPGEERAELHARAAELAYRAAVPDEDIARLLLAAGPVDEPWVIPVLRRTCAAALRAGRTAQAIACLSRALEEPLDPAPRAQLGLELAAIEVLAAPEAAGRRLAEIIRTGDGGPGRIRARAADLGLSRGDDKALRRAIADVLPSTYGEERVALAGLFWLTESDGQDDTDLIPDGIPPLPDDPICPAQAAARAWRLALRGDDLPTARALAQRVFTVDGSAGALILPRLTAARTLLLTDDLDEAEVRLDVLHTDLRRRHARAAAAQVLAVRGELNLRRGRLDMAERDVAAAERSLPRSLWHRYTVPYLMAARILIALENGDLGQAGVLAAGSAPAESREGASWGYLLFARALVALKQDRIPEALELFRATGRWQLGRGRINPALMPWRSMAARVHDTLGDHGEARRLTEEELALARLWGAPNTIGWAQLGVGRVVREGRVDRLREAVATLRGTPARLAYAGALMELATAEFDAGNPRAADPLVAELFSFVIANRSSSKLVARVRELSERTGPSAAGGRVPHPEWETLTEPEQRTAVLVGLGHGNREIAETLSVTRRTVELRLSGAYRKLGVSGRAELIGLLRATKGGGTGAA